MKRPVLFILAAFLAAVPVAAHAQMTHVVVGDSAKKKEKEADESAAGEEEYSGGSHVVTSVGDCFGKLPAAEARTIQRDYENPWHECQRRVKKAGLDKPEKKKDGGKEEDKKDKVEKTAEAEGEEEKPSAGKKPGKKDEPAEKESLKKRFLEVLEASKDERYVYNP